MGKTKKMKRSWKEYRKTISSGWQVPFGFAEWICERISAFLVQLAFFEILEYGGRLSLLVSFIVGVYFYVTEADERRMQAAYQRKAKHYQAWQVISAAQGKPGSGGRMEALICSHILYS